MMNELHEQIIDLQTRLAHQEDSLAQLNQVITQQDADILQLRQQMRLLVRKLDESLYAQSLEGVSGSNERPPHY
jgi:SlyX protein